MKQAQGSRAHQQRVCENRALSRLRGPGPGREQLRTKLAAQSTCKRRTASSALSKGNTCACGVALTRRRGDARIALTGPYSVRVSERTTTAQRCGQASRGVPGKCEPGGAAGAHRPDERRTPRDLRTK
jgi:hypothetical protein